MCAFQCVRGNIVALSYKLSKKIEKVRAGSSLSEEMTRTKRSVIVRSERKILKAS